jgi:hypothetical protein
LKKNNALYENMVEELGWKKNQESEAAQHFV